MPIIPSRPGPARRSAQAVTTARRSQDEDRRQRMRSYLIAMGIRTISFPAAVWAFMSGHPVWGWIFMINAVLIPSFAVAVANAVDRRGQSQTAAAPVSPVQGLGPATSAPSTEDDPERTSGSHGSAYDEDAIPGTVVGSRTVPAHGPGAHAPRPGR